MCDEEAFFKISILSQLTQRFSAIAVKITTGFAVNFDKLILKCSQKSKEPSIPKTLKKKKAGRLALSKNRA